MPMKIQQLTVSNPDSETPSVELTIADSAEIDEASAYLVAFVTIDRDGTSLEGIQMNAIKKIESLIDEARNTTAQTAERIKKARLEKGLIGPS